jgi:hypothetical protein
MVHPVPARKGAKIHVANTIRFIDNNSFPCLRGLPGSGADNLLGSASGAHGFENRSR